MSRKKNIALVILVILLMVVPFVIAKNAEFAGSDDLAKKAISEMNNNYKPWAKPIWTPPSPEIESFLFSLQAALGAGFIGYFIGLSRGRNGK